MNFPMHTPAGDGLRRDVFQLEACATPAQFKLVLLKYKTKLYTVGYVVIIVKLTQQKLSSIRYISTTLLQNNHLMLTNPRDAFRGHSRSSKIPYSIRHP